MRFEELDFTSQINTLYRFRDSLNKNLFHGSLKEIPIEIENISGHMDEDYWGGYLKPMELHPFGLIKIDLLLLDDLKKVKTQKEQIYLLSQILLHEMIHQYCYENRIDDSNHNSNFMTIAEKHGLHSMYDNGVQHEEYLLTVGLMCICNYTMYPTTKMHEIKDEDVRNAFPYNIIYKNRKSSSKNKNR